MKFNKALKNISVYEAGKPIEFVIEQYGIKSQDIIKLASNENPYGVSKKVALNIQKNAKNAYRYPDDSMSELKRLLAKKHNVAQDNIIVGAGSDQVIFFAINAKCKEDSNILISNTTFAMYEIYAKQIGCNVIKTPSSKHRLDEFYNIYQNNKNTKQQIDIIFLCLPNNPLGECAQAEEVTSFLDKIDDNTLVVLDLAYNDYATFKDVKKQICPNEIVKKYNNVLCLNTFSKSYALGGMRVGYGISTKEIISNLYKIRPPFNITTLSLSSAICALKNDKFVKKSISKNFKQMKKYEEFAKEHNISFIDSYTNFIVFIFDAKEYNRDKISTFICDELLKKGIIIRNISYYKPNAIRITIGTKEQNKRLLKELKSIIGKLKAK